MSVTDVNLTNWKKEVEDSSNPVVVEFWSPKCVWCQKLEPAYQELSKEYSDRIKFVKVNALAEPQLATRYGVMSTPTLKFLCSGRPVGEHIGFAPKDHLKGRLEEVLKYYRRCLNQSTPYG